MRCHRLFILLVAALACDSSTGPRNIVHYALQSIDDRPLPTFLLATSGPVTTITSGSLTLDGAGKAVLSQHFLEGSDEGTSTVTHDYKITGTEIEIGTFDSCVTILSCPNAHGSIEGSQLRLGIDLGQRFVTYKYQLSGN